MVKRISQLKHSIHHNEEKNISFIAVISLQHIFGMMCIFQAIKCFGKPKKRIDRKSIRVYNESAKSIKVYKRNAKSIKVYKQKRSL